MTNQIPARGLITFEKASTDWAQWTWREMHELLTKAMDQTMTKPDDWPPAPPPPPHED